MVAILARVQAGEAVCFNSRTVTSSVFSLLQCGAALDLLPGRIELPICHCPAGEEVRPPLPGTEGEPEAEEPGE